MLSMLASMIVFTLLYAALGAVWYLLLRRYIREGVRTPAGPDAATTGDIGDFVGGNWNNHPLAMELGVAVYGYLEQKCKGGGSK